MKKRKITALTLAVCMLLGCAACTPIISDETAADESAAADDGTQTTESETLVMATDATFPPYEYSVGQEFAGIDIDIAYKIAEKLGLVLEIKNMAFNDIIAAVQSKTVDIGMAALTADEARLASVNFSASYATSKQAIIVSNDSDIAVPADLAGKKIGVVQNTAGSTYCTEDFGESAIESHINGTDAVKALQQGRVDAVVIDSDPANILVKANENIEVLESEYKLDYYAIAINKDRTSLLQRINSALAELETSGDIQAIIDQYIKAE